MAFYLIIFSILFLPSFFKSKIPFYFSAGLLIFIAGSRTVDVGTDTYSYFHIFNEAQQDLNRFEIGWYILNIICGSIYDNFNFFLFVVSAVTIGCVCFVLRRETPNVQFGLSLYYVFCFCISINIMRQFLAISIVYIGLSYLSKNKVGKFIFFVGLASLFHGSALFALIALISRYISLKLKIMCVLISISVVLGFFMNDRVMELISFNYFDYIEAGGKNSYKENFGLIGISLSFISFLLIYLMCKKNENNTFWLKILFLNLLVSCLLFRIQLGGRLNYYFTISSIILYSRYFLVIGVQRYLIPVLILVLLRFVKDLMSMSSADAVTAIPYRSIFFQ